MGRRKGTALRRNMTTTKVSPCCKGAQLGIAFFGYRGGGGGGEVVTMPDLCRSYAGRLFAGTHIGAICI